MRTFLIPVLAVALLPAVLFAQPGVPRDVEFALMRLEQAFRSASPATIEDLLQSGMMIRIGNALHKNVSSVEALDLLKRFFSDKDSIDFRFTTLGSGRMIYSVAGSRDTTHVDIWFYRPRGEPLLFALNISNYPLATVFMDIPGPRR